MTFTMRHRAKGEGPVWHILTALAAAFLENIPQAGSSNHMKTVTQTKPHPMVISPHSGKTLCPFLSRGFFLFWLLVCLPGQGLAVATDLPFTEADVLAAPQDLALFAAQAGENRLLLSPAEQAQRDQKANSLFFGPLSQTRPSLHAKRFGTIFPRKPRGYHMDRLWTADEWNALIHQAHIEAYPTPKGPAVVTRHTDIRSMPTDRPLYLEPTPEPAVDFFDFFQLASIPLGTPVYVSHTSRDGQWLYVEYPLLNGWVRALDVAVITRSLSKAYANGRYAVVVRDQVSFVAADGSPLGTAHMGSVFPFAEGDAGPLLVPVREADGTARLERVLPPEGSVLPKPLPLTPANLALLGNRMLGQPYAWGGSGQNRDCSLAVRDLLLPFGIWLPRNSRAQTQSRGAANLARLSPQARKAHILRHGKPFLTLLGFPGHVGLYVGSHKGEPVMLHNILGLRTNTPETFYRHIIGRCVLSTLEAGKNVPQLLLEESLLQRLHNLRVL